MTTSTLSLPETSSERSPAERIDASAQAVDALTETVHAWPGVSLSIRSGRVVTFTVRDRVFGCLRPDGFVEVLLPRGLCNALLAEHGSTALATTESGGCVGVRVSAVLDDAAFVLRLGYLYRRVVGSRDGAALDRIAAELDDLHVDGVLRDAYDAVLTRRRRTVAPPDRPRTVVPPPREAA